MLTITKLKGAEYLISSVAAGMEDYYMGAGEAPGVWRGAWAAELGLEGVVSAEDLRAVVNGHDPTTGGDLLAGRRERTVRAIDVTLSCPKSVSVLWAFGTPETSAVVSIAVVEATEAALTFLEERAAFARLQQGGVRRRVGTDGFAIATFAHRTSRAGDPQLHTHCLIPNVVRRCDGEFVAFDANPLHTWAKAAGTVFLNELERTLTARLGVEWGPERSGCREMVGFTRQQLRTFSKRTVAIETRLEAVGELAFATRRERMRADDRASLATRERKDKTLTPERLRDRWHGEATAVGLEPGANVDDLVVGRQVAALPALDDTELFGALVDPITGLCASDSRFGEAHVVERVAAISGGRLAVDEIVGVSQRFLASELIVRLAPGVGRRRPPEWSTVEHRTVEDRLLARLEVLAGTPGDPIDTTVVDAALAGEPRRLGVDQADAVRILCGDGASVRVLVAPAGFGKTTALSAAVTAQIGAGRHVVALAATHKAVGELQGAGLDAQTIARFLVEVADEPIRADTTVIVDETSQVGTRHAAALLDAVTRTPGVQLWCVGDSRQAQSVAAGGFALEVERLAADSTIPWATLIENRRQHDPAEQAALASLRAGDVDASRQLRDAHGWEHEHATPRETRQALAETAVADADRYGVDHVAVLAVSHADCEDVADRIRAIRTARGELHGPTQQGPGWGLEPRVYAAGDRILIHTNLGGRTGRRLVNGTTATVLNVADDGAHLLLDNDRRVFLPVAVIGGCRPDGTPNVSHAWARTVDGAQGGTWHQVHLLGTPALDRFTGYVGQSRGQQPTHTWNTRADTDRPQGLLADQRTPSEVVADAMRRADPKTLAAQDDPWTLDRALRTERAEHAAIVATRPPDRRRELEHARESLTRAEYEHHEAVRGLALREQERLRVGPLTRLRRGGRDDITRADQAVAGALRRVARATTARDDAHGDVERVENAVAERAAWDDQHQWRLPRIAEIDHGLAHHWADIILRAVHADDPLAFGTQQLRHAAATYRTDLHDIVRGLPDNHHDTFARAQTNLDHQKNHQRAAERSVVDTRVVLEQISRRPWPRRDKTAIIAVRARLDTGENTLVAAREAVGRSEQRVADGQHAVDTWEAAYDATADERTRLADAVTDIYHALDHTRPHRVAAATTDPTSSLWHTLGAPPTTRGGLAAWCGIAEHLETWNDQHPGQPAVNKANDPRITDRLGRGDNEHPDELAAILDNAADIIHTASRLDPTPADKALDDRNRWQPAIETAQRVLAAERPVPAVEYDLGLEL